MDSDALSTDPGKLLWAHFVVPDAPQRSSRAWHEQKTSDRSKMRPISHAGCKDGVRVPWSAHLQMIQSRIRELDWDVLGEAH